jgi:hypothetical protein
MESGAPPPPARQGVILVDTSIWVDHFRRSNAELVEGLQLDKVLLYPFIVGEIACGSLRKRADTLELLQKMPMATVAEFDEVLGYVERHRLYGKGISFIEVHLLASAVMSSATLWTRDKRLNEVTQALGCAH